MSTSRNPPVVECPCGRAYTAVEWDALPLIGYQEAAVGVLDRDHAYLYELRDCVCTSTRLRRVTHGAMVKAINAHLKAQRRAREEAADERARIIAYLRAEADRLTRADKIACQFTADQPGGHHINLEIAWAFRRMADQLETQIASGS